MCRNLPNSKSLDRCVRALRVAGDIRRTGGICRAVSTSRGFPSSLLCDLFGAAAHRSTGHNSPNDAQLREFSAHPAPTARTVGKRCRSAAAVLALEIEAALRAGRYEFCDVSAGTCAHRGFVPANDSIARWNSAHANSHSCSGRARTERIGTESLSSIVRN